jgi:hypothetical protein
MHRDDSAYYEQRAEEARDRAQQAIHPAAVRAIMEWRNFILSACSTVGLKRAE